MTPCNTASAMAHLKRDRKEFMLLLTPHSCGSYILIRCAGCSHMIYLKSVLVGLLGLVAFGVVIIVAALGATAVRDGTRSGLEFEFVGIDLRAPFISGLALLVFARAFYWEYRKLSR
jgi:hypothetical protein